MRIPPRVGDIAPKLAGPAVENVFSDPSFDLPWGRASTSAGTFFLPPKD